MINSNLKRLKSLKERIELLGRIRIRVRDEIGKGPAIWIIDEEIKVLKKERSRIQLMQMKLLKRAD